MTCQAKCSKKYIWTRKTQGENTRTKGLCMQTASTKTPALLVQQKLRKGQRNTEKINKNNNRKKKTTLLLYQTKQVNQQKVQKKNRHYSNNKPVLFTNSA